MIKLFRKIRQNAIKENKTTNYLKYAIGEIVLVVIGILIALSINNWNENRKSKVFEREILTQIRANLRKDKFSLETIEINFANGINSSNKILKREWSEQDRDSLKYWLSDIIQFERFQPLTNAYEVLKSKGLDQISNKQLGFLLGSYYDDEVQHAVKSIGDIENTFNIDWLPIMKEEVEDFKFQTYVIVRDFDIFRKTTPARNLLRMNRDNFRGGVNRICKVIEMIEKIQDIIDQELKK